jgi:hypothetical protein
VGGLFEHEPSRNCQPLPRPFPSVQGGINGALAKILSTNPIQLVSSLGAWRVDAASHARVYRSTRVAIVQQSVLQIGGPLISKPRAQLAHKMTSVCGIPPEIGNRRRRPCRNLRHWQPSYLRCGPSAKRGPKADVHQPRWVGTGKGSAKGSRVIGAGIVVPTHAVIGGN